MVCSHAFDLMVYNSSLLANLLSYANILQINLKADERDVYEFFSRAGKVICFLVECGRRLRLCSKYILSLS